MTLKIKVRKVKVDKSCAADKKCTAKTKYFYSKELAEYMGWVLWQGGFFCKAHFEEIEEKWQKEQS